MKTEPQRLELWTRGLVGLRGVSGVKRLVVFAVLQFCHAGAWLHETAKSTSTRKSPTVNRTVNWPYMAFSRLNWGAATGSYDTGERATPSRSVRATRFREQSRKIREAGSAMRPQHGSVLRTFVSGSRMLAGQCASSGRGRIRAGVLTAYVA